MHERLRDRRQNPASVANRSPVIALWQPVPQLPRLEELRSLGTDAEIAGQPTGVVRHSILDRRIAS